MRLAGLRFVLAAAVLTAPLASAAQSAATPPIQPNKLIRFEVASVRLQAEPLGGPVRFTADGFSADAAPLEYLIRNAYNITRDNSVRGLPPWGATDYYVVSAKVGDSDLAEWKTYNAAQKREVLQQFLADRFHLAVHPQTIEVPTYSLVAAKSGSKLKQVTPPEGDRRGFIESRAAGVVVGHHVVIGNLADLLSRSYFGLGRQVYDNTGLTANYDFTLTFEPLRPQGAGAGDATEPSGRSSIFTALDEQLGLRLEPSKGPLDTIVIDHVERPSEN
ncbi:MAG TPA: TIGR03435 family protein [Acidobacteriaceae bacterium]|nr:TIGR03435 family protein [Acidobacteriaceae bacterium]